MLSLLEFIACLVYNRAVSSFPAKPIHSHLYVAFLGDADEAESATIDL